VESKIVLLLQMQGEIVKLRNALIVIGVVHWTLASPSLGAEETSQQPVDFSVLSVSGPFEHDGLNTFCSLSVQFTNKSTKPLRIVFTAGKGKGSTVWLDDLTMIHIKSATYFERELDKASPTSFSIVRCDWTPKDTGKTTSELVALSSDDIVLNPAETKELSIPIRKPECLGEANLLVTFDNRNLKRILDTHNLHDKTAVFFKAVDSVKASVK
jgi:hypothetical protein